MNQEEQEIIKQFDANVQNRKHGDGLIAVKLLSDLMWDKIALILKDHLKGDK